MDAAIADGRTLNRGAEGSLIFVRLFHVALPELLRKWLLCQCGALRSFSGRDGSRRGGWCSRAWLASAAPSSVHQVLLQNFGMIETGLYRSGQPSELSFPFLEHLGLRHAVWLAPEEPNTLLYARGALCRHLCTPAPTLLRLDFLEDQGIQL